jgi:hypothetical protein
MAANDTSNQQELTAFKHVLGLMDRHGNDVMPHDLSDPLQVAYLQGLARRSGMTPERYPALFDLISRPPEQPAFDLMAHQAAAQDNGDAFISNQDVNYIGHDANGLVASRALFTRTNPIDRATVWLNVFNTDDNTVYASGTGYAHLQQTLYVETDPSTAQPYPADANLAAVMSWAVEYVDGTSETSSGASPWAYNTDGDPVVSAPIQNPNRQTGDLSSIVIGLSRGFNSPANNTDIDYWFWQNQWENLTMLVPLVGSMKFLYPIASKSVNNPTLEFGLTLKAGGMSKINTLPYLGGFSIDGQDPTKLNFSLQATPTDAGNAINFGPCTWRPDTKAYFVARVHVMLAQGKVGWSSILSSDQADADPADGVAYIKPIMYVWHCLVAGTMILMADGTTRAVETLNVGDVVSSGGTPRAVLATLAQPHFGPVYNLIFSDGSNLICSGTHPIMTPGGAVQAANLLVGQQVNTNGNPVSLTSTNIQQQDGDGLFNLWLDPGPAGPSVMIANGIEVGDYLMQVALIDEEANDPVRVRAKLPARLHQDYESYLADTAARA